MKLRSPIAARDCRSARARAFADEPQVKVETVLTGLTNPCGVAIQPSTGSRIRLRHRRRPDRQARLPTTDKSTPVVTGFPQANDTIAKNPPTASALWAWRS